MRSGEKLRLRLFELYARNLSLLVENQKWKIGYNNDEGKFEEAHSAYVCPICSKLFVKESLDQSNTNPLTLEDVPPKALGGRPILLTCKNCNNKLGGAKLDKSLKHSLEVEPFAKGEPKGGIDAYYEINQRTKVKGRFVFLDKDKYWMEFNPKSNPNISKELDELVNKWDGANIKVNFQMPNERFVSLAILRIAYLKLFSFFGYAYFFDKSSRILREQLTDPENKILSEIGIPSLNEDISNHEGIHLIKKPVEIKSYLVIIKLNYKNRKKTVPVIMPGPSDNYLSLLKRIREHGKFNLNLIKIPEMDFLTDKDKILAYQDIWNGN